jgi:hypothetical protein
MNGKPDTDSIIAHVDLLRAVDRLLSDAEEVRQKRAHLDELVNGKQRKSISLSLNKPGGERRGK